MQLNVPPDLEMLINKRLSSGGYTGVVDVLRRALEAQDAGESWTDEQRRALSAHMGQGYQPAPEADAAAAVRRLAVFGKRHGLSLRGSTVKELLRESGP